MYSACARRASSIEEVEELRGDVGPRAVQVQVGNEERRHFTSSILMMITGFSGASRSNGPRLARGDLTDIVDDVHPFHDAAEYRVAPAARLRIEHRVVGHVDIELRGAAVRIAGAREAD